ncbi:MULTISPECIES: nucleoside deaminase [unclassified Rathayibacter]|uniref:nucleoside deaminase n=1 Tax=unclassified Rathayibacter TaxID=2609250 RepID=UPI00188A2859|nr:MULTISPECIES: nucleoside deaminase [unclassified Rathayibacter]MBF4460997.1 nucleoside deaminase [Rathayibacter sp. VKM Ac-2879]MBF4502408.1 nucleoside deaminase [Rathayibacter sp. VKM Ac-2878]
MNIDRLATRFEITLPEWIGDAVRDIPEVLPTLEERMALVHALADRNFREGNGGPFAAIVVERDSGRLVAVGVNVVLASGISSGHAEVTALGLAQTALGAWDLGGDGLPAHELVVNWRPCVQCYGATLWSGVRRLVVAGSGPELEEITTFDEGPMRDDWAAAFEARHIEVVDGVLRAEALDVFRAYRASVDAGGSLVYNARAASD